MSWGTPRPLACSNTQTMRVTTHKRLCVQTHKCPVSGLCQGPAPVHTCAVAEAQVPCQDTLGNGKDRHGMFNRCKACHSVMPLQTLSSQCKTAVTQCRGQANVNPFVRNNLHACDSIVRHNVTPPRHFVAHDPAQVCTKSPVQPLSTPCPPTTYGLDKPAIRRWHATCNACLTSGRPSTRARRMRDKASQRHDNMAPALWFNGSCRTGHNTGPGNKPGTGAVNMPDCSPL